MAKIVKTIEQEWYKCKDCPYFQWKYSGPDGFGERELYEAGYCTKGHFGGIAYNSNGNDVYKRVSVPNCIPPYCEFSDNPLTGDEKLKDLLDLDNEEITLFLDFLRQRPKIMSEDAWKDMQDKGKQTAFKEYKQRVIQELKDGGYSMDSLFLEGEE